MTAMSDVADCLLLVVIRGEPPSIQVSSNAGEKITFVTTICMVVNSFGHAPLLRSVERTREA